MMRANMPDNMKPKGKKKMSKMNTGHMMSPQEMSKMMKKMGMR